MDNVTQDKFRVERLKKLDKLRELGVDPYGGRFDGVESMAGVRARAKPLEIEAGAIL